MEKQKVFIPVEDIFHEYDGTYLPKSGKPLNIKEHEGYLITEDQYGDIHSILSDSYNQIKYLHEKFKETGSGNSVLNKITNLIQSLNIK